jgi:effector-binding domain-containing protein
MSTVKRTLAVLARWLEDNEHRADGHAREVYLDYCQDDPARGVTELQIPLG